MGSIANKIYAAADTATMDWFKRQCANVYASMYLYYKPGSIAFWIGEDPPAGWELGLNERISPAWSIEAVRHKVIAVAQSLPILGAP